MLLPAGGPSPLRPVELRPPVGGWGYDELDALLNLQGSPAAILPAQTQYSSPWAIVANGSMQPDGHGRTQRVFASVPDDIQPHWNALASMLTGTHVFGGVLYAPLSALRFNGPVPPMLFRRPQPCHDNDLPPARLPRPCPPNPPNGQRRSRHARRATAPA
jgi:hypothetical protein